MKKMILCLVVLLLAGVSHSFQDPDFFTGTGWSVNGTASVSYNGYCNITKQIFNSATEVYQQETAFTAGKNYQVQIVITSLGGTLDIGWQDAGSNWKSGSFQAVTNSTGTFTLTCSDSAYNYVVIDAVSSVCIAQIDSATTSQLSDVSDWELY